MRSQNGEMRPKLVQRIIGYNDSHLGLCQVGDGLDHLGGVAFRKQVVQILDSFRGRSQCLWAVASL